MRYESLPYSECANMALCMIGSGRTSIASASDFSRACVKDMGKDAPAAVHALASLGSWGSHSQNQERDLHKWANQLYNLNLQTYDTQIPLQADNETGVVDTLIPFLLPHEIFEALSAAGKYQFSLSMTGGRSGPEIAAFWDHCFQQEEWRNHPARFLPYVKRDRLIPIAFHIDGAEFYSNSEFYVWSIGSTFPTGDVWDVKFPMCIVPHAWMQDKKVKNECHRLVATIATWSMRCALKGLQRVRD